MFVSINKKILYSLFLFLLILIGIFFVIFISMYQQQLEKNQNSVYMRNQYVVELLHDNIRLQKEFSEILRKYPHISSSVNPYLISQSLDVTQQKLSREQKLNAELQKNYDNTQEAIITGAKIVSISIGVVILFILLLFFILNRWVIHPINRLTKISRKVSQGIFSSRVNIDDNKVLNDEFDILGSTFNNMLDTMEKNITDIKEREKFLQQLIDAIPDGIRVIDGDYKVIMANKAFYKILNMKKPCIGKNCYHAYGYSTYSCPQSKYRCPLQYLRNEKNSSLRTIHEVGKRPLYVNAVQLKSLDNKSMYIVESLHDLSGDIRFSHQQKVSSLAFLSTSIAHEMKNNLGAIRLILEGLLETEYKDVSENNMTKKYLSMIHKQLVETVKTPERLLRLAQFSEVDNAKIDVASAIKDMILMIDYDAKRYGIDVKTEIGKNLYISGNEADFKMIVLNLMQNAIKAMTNGGKLQITGNKKQKMIYLQFADTGTGIAEDALKHIFEPFYSANEQNKSSGLGLAIVSSLVEKLHGKISVKSKPGAGTTFTISIPCDNSKD